jgi:hypothetical protein
MSKVGLLGEVATGKDGQILRGPRRSWSGGGGTVAAPGRRARGQGRSGWGPMIRAVTGCPVSVSQ